MDEFALSDTRVLTYLNNNYKAIRVNPNERPDLNHRYNSGRLPSYAILTPTGEILTGESYLEPDNLLFLLTQTKHMYDRNKEKLRTSLSQQRSVPDPAELLSTIINEVSEYAYQQLQNSFDPLNGGFIGAPKYPQPEIIDYLLNRFYNTNDIHSEEMAVKTLDHMQQSKLYDASQHGFFILSNTPDWNSPERVKLLETNARLLNLYTRVPTLIKNNDYLTTAQGIVNFLLAQLYTDQNYFIGGIYADSLMDKDTKISHFEYYKDTTFYVNWNANTVIALAQASVMFDDPSYLSVAKDVMETILKQGMDVTSGLFYHFIRNEIGYMPELLSDQAVVMEALITLYEFTGDERYEQQAHTLMTRILAFFYDAQFFGFFDRKSYDKHDVLQPEKILQENCLLVTSLLKLEFMVINTTYREIANKTLTSFKDKYEQLGVYSAVYAHALEVFYGPRVEIFIIGNPGDSTRIHMIQAVKKKYLPLYMMKIYSPDGAVIKREPLTFYFNGSTLGYVSINGKLWGPYFNAEDLVKKLDDAR